MLKFPNVTKQVLCTKPETISLSDCLACSGCITSDESGNFEVDTSFLALKDVPSSFIISSYSKISLHSYYSQVSYEDFEKCLIKFLKDRFNVYRIVDTSYFRKDELVGISSECPAVVLYIERVYPTLIERLSTHKTFQQIAADFISKELRNKSEFTQKNDHRIISIMQCYDKKDEMNRDGVDITHFLGSREFYEFIRMDFSPCSGIDYSLEAWERTHFSNVSSRYGKISTKEDQTDLGDNLNPLPGMNEISGLENCINTMNRAKGEDVGNIELRICKGGCIKGPAQVNLESMELQNYDPDMTYYSPVYFRTSQRAFFKPKKKSFNIEW